MVFWMSVVRTSSSGMEFEVWQEKSELKFQILQQMNKELETDFFDREKIRRYVGGALSTRALWNPLSLFRTCGWKERTTRTDRNPIQESIDVIFSSDGKTLSSPISYSFSTWHCGSRLVWAAFCLETLPSRFSSTIYRYLWRIEWAVKVHVPRYARRFGFCLFCFFLSSGTPHKTFAHMTHRLITSSTGEQRAHITCELLCSIVAICFSSCMFTSYFFKYELLLVEWWRQTADATADYGYVIRFFVFSLFG